MSISTNVSLFQSRKLDVLNDLVQLDAIYSDFQRTFDKVNHRILLNKLVFLGIYGVFLDWIKSYIGSCTQSVKVSFNISNNILVSSGVSQASHPGSLLFILFKNDDLPSVFDSSVDILLFVDDAKIFSIVSR